MLDNNVSVVFPANTGDPTFYRTYSRSRIDSSVTKESVNEVFERCLRGLFKLGNYTTKEQQLIREKLYSLKTLMSGRWLWVGGMEFLDKPKNYYAAYNCIGMKTEELEDIARAFNFLMQGCGVGASITTEELSKLPKMVNNVKLVDITPDHMIGSAVFPLQTTEVRVNTKQKQVSITVADTREGWTTGFLALLNVFTNTVNPVRNNKNNQYALYVDGNRADKVDINYHVDLTVDLTNPRKKGTPIKGFGGVANPKDLPNLFKDTVNMCNKYVGREWDSFLAAWLYGVEAKATVAGNVRRCLPEDALVHTSKGLVAIKDVQIGDLVQTPLGFRKVLNKFDQGVQDVYELETNAGNPRATLNHRVAVFTDASGSIQWKKVCDLSENDRLVHTNKILSGTTTELPLDNTKKRPNYSRTAKSITIPTLTPEVAWLIGFTHGNGYVALGRNKYDKPYGSVSWSMNSSELELSKVLCEKIDRALNAFGLKARHTVCNKENTLRSVCSSVRLAEYFYQHIKQPDVPLEVPTFILQSTIDVRSAYLAGLFDSDGSLRTRPVQLVCTVYKNFADQISVLMSSLGIVTRVKLVSSTNTSWQIKHLVTLPAFKNRFNTLIAPHSAKGFIKEATKNESFTFTGDMMRNSYTYNQIKSMGFSTDKAANCTYERLLTHQELDLDIPVTFKALGSYNSIQTYDIEVEEAHCFYCDGYLTHNSAELMQGSSDDVVFGGLKDNLWTVDKDGNWSIDPEKNCLRMANHTRMYQTKPSKQEVVEAVTKQFFSGEGAIGYAPTAVIRCNADLLNTKKKKDLFHDLYLADIEAAKRYLKELNPNLTDKELQHRVDRWRANPCYEILGSNFMCVDGNTPIITRNNLVKIKDVVGVPIEVWNGDRWSTVTPIKTGSNRKLYRVQFSDGSYLDVTENHNFYVKTRFQAEYSKLPTKDLLSFSKYKLFTEPFTINTEEGEEVPYDFAYTCGYALSNGYTASNIQETSGSLMALSTVSAVITNNTVNTLLNSPELLGVKTDRGIDTGINKNYLDNLLASLKPFSWSRQAVLYLIAGLIDGDPTNNLSNVMRIKVAGEELARIVQLLLTKVGIKSSISVGGLNTAYVAFNSYAELPTQILTRPVSANNREQDAFILSITELEGLHDTYCFEEPFNHKAVFGNTLTGNCNLSEVHLNQLDPFNIREQDEAFEAGGLITASLLQHTFDDEKFRYSREIDPIVGVSFTGLFDFFVNAFGAEWLLWWKEGRSLDSDIININSRLFTLAFPSELMVIVNSYKSKLMQGATSITSAMFSEMEKWYLSHWRDVAVKAVATYCERNGLRIPNRITTVQPAGCLTKEAVRVFDKGILMAHEHMEANGGEYNLEQQQLTVRDGIAVTSGIANNLMQLVRITLNNGRQITMTPNHRLSISGNWIMAKDMQVGQQIDYKLYTYKNEQEASLIPSSKSLTLPTTMSPELAYLLGIGLNITSSKTGAEEEVIINAIRNISGGDRATNLYRSVFGELKTSATPAAIAALKDWLQLNHLIVNEKTDDYIPKAVRTSSKSSILAFIAGYLERHSHTNKNLAVNVQQVAEAVGLCFSLHTIEASKYPFKINAGGYELKLNVNKSYEPSVNELYQYMSTKDVELVVDDLPYMISKIEETTDYTYDYAVDGKDDNDSWYWQGAIKSHNTKSLLTGASCGYHLPKAQRYIRRITFAKDDPIALACLDFGYSVVPAQSDTDENGKLLNDPHDPRCTEWLVEIPVEVNWAAFADEIDVDISKFSAKAQFDFFMQVQEHYSQHNVSSTIELRQEEIEELSESIYQAIQHNTDYVSTALLSRFDSYANFPRLPFEPISKSEYEQQVADMHTRRKIDTFYDAIRKYYTNSDFEDDRGSVACEKDMCQILPSKK
jgi:ribonucleotide reductase class II